VHCRRKLSCEDVKSDGGRFEDGGFASVVARVRRTGVPDYQMTLGLTPILGDHSNAATWGLVRYHLVVVVPENVRRWLWTVGDNTSEIDGGSPVNVQVRRTLDPNVRNYDVEIDGV